MRPTRSSMVEEHNITMTGGFPLLVWVTFVVSWCMLYGTINIRFLGDKYLFILKLISSKFHHIFYRMLCLVASSFPNPNMFFRPHDYSLFKLFGVGLDLHGWCRVATTAFHVQSWRPNCVGAKQHYLLSLAATYKTIDSSNIRTALLLSPQHWSGCTTTLAQGETNHTFTRTSAQWTFLLILTSELNWDYFIHALVKFSIYFIWC